MAAFVEHDDEPVILKYSVKGEPGFRLLPQGEDDNEILFTSARTLVNWCMAALFLAYKHDEAQPYEEWLETN